MGRMAPAKVDLGDEKKDIGMCIIMATVIGNQIMTQNEK